MPQEPQNSLASSQNNQNHVFLFFHVFHHPYRQQSSSVFRQESQEALEEEVRELREELNRIRRTMNRSRTPVEEVSRLDKDLKAAEKTVKKSGEKAMKKAANVPEDRPLKAGEKVRVRLDSEPDTLRTYQNDEIRVIRSGKGKRPEGYVEPPKEELERLRKSSESPEERTRREQAALSAALRDCCWWAVRVTR